MSAGQARPAASLACGGASSSAARRLGRVPLRAVGFPESYIAADEELILNLRPHWWQLATPVAIAVGGLIVFVLVAQLGVDALNWVFGLVFVGTLVNLAVKYAQWTTTYFVLTSERLITRKGLVSKLGVEIPLDRINNVNFEQGMFERLIHAGDLLIESAGERGQSKLTNVRQPDAVQNAVLTAMEDYRSRFYGAHHPAAQAAGPAAHSVPEQIRQLDELRQQGLISEDEFAAKKAELLGRM
jgi:uncharacterized membrane protein YdbT with pleckstrin-like domain